MCGHKAEAWRAYQAAWARDKLAAAEHTIENLEAELSRHRKFVSEKRLTVEWIKREMRSA